MEIFTIAVVHCSPQWVCFVFADKVRIINIAIFVVICFFHRYIIRHSSFIDTIIV